MTKYGFATLSAFVFGIGTVFSGNALAVDGDAARGDRLASSCMACHGTEGRSNMPSMYPHLAGRDAQELADLLTAYRDGDIDEPQMTPQAQNLSDQDIADLAVYFSEQEPAE